jgi:hypothetical protein
MGRVLETEVKDPTLRAWIIPAFNTTTTKDVVASSIAMMATLQRYFSYECCLKCGLPSVTLLGEKADYELILQRLDYLKQFGDEPATFAEYLEPVIAHFISSFDEPDSPRTKDFWNKIASKYSRGSGSELLTGWITSFCFWDENGRVKLPMGQKLGEVQYGFEITADSVPPGYAMVPVKVTDNGEEVETVMIARSLAIELRGTQECLVSADYNTTQLYVSTMQPELRWLTFEEERGGEVAKWAWICDGCSGNILAMNFD